MNKKKQVWYLYSYDIKELKNNVMILYPRFMFN